jgi:alanyl-tRNA synthetase
VIWQMNCGVQEKVLYFSEPYLHELNTRVTDQKQEAQGIWFAFEQTIFYPQGGGQSADRGWINGLAVLDVQKEEETVWHLLSGKIAPAAEMKIDWDYRYNNMRQHTGQHILSASFSHLFNFATASVHLGSEDTLIELHTSSISQDQLWTAEEHANGIIHQNLPVKQAWVYRTELQQYNLRRDIKVEEDPVRIIQIGDHDCTGCGGTHVHATGEVGLIKIIGTEKIRKHIRVQSKIGTSAYRYYNRLNNTARQVCTLLSMELDDLAPRIQMLLDEQRDLKRQIKAITEKWLYELAKDLLPVDRFGLFSMTDLTSEHLNKISEFWLEKNNQPCLMLSSSDDRIYFVMRTPRTLKSSARAFIQESGKDLQLKGGGSEDFVQGIITRPYCDQEYLAALEKSLTHYFLE